MNPKSSVFRIALRIKSAELWLKLGERRQALMELEALPRSFWDHPAVTLLLRSGTRVGRAQACSE
jgi:hypothetical protein